MSDTDGAAPAAPSTGELSIAQAVERLGTPPKQREEQDPAAPEERPPPRGKTPSPPSPDRDDAEPEEAPGETEAASEDEAEEPPIKPPRTWTKAEKEAFNLLPREHQQSIVDRESERDSYYQRGLREAAQKSQAAEQARQAAEQERVRYEQALPQILQQFSTQFQTEFQDIKTWDDVSNMQRENPMRFQEWQLAREKGQTLQKETAAAQEREQQNRFQAFERYVLDQDAQLAKKRPEFADPAKATKLGQEARQMLVDDYGVEEDELNAGWAGQPISLRDHRWQMVIVDALRYRQAKAAKATAAPKALPPVQRPGTATNRGEAGNVSLKILNDKLTRSGRIEDAVAVLNAKSKLTARRR